MIEFHFWTQKEKPSWWGKTVFPNQGGLSKLKSLKHLLHGFFVSLAVLSFFLLEYQRFSNRKMGVLFVAQGLTFLGLLAGSYSSFKIVKGGVSKNAEAKGKSVTMLKFWVMYSFLILFDMTIDPWVSWLPFYDYAKLLLLLYIYVSCIFHFPIH